MIPVGVTQSSVPWQRVSVAPASPVDLTWRARAGEAGGHFRLYRIEAGGEPAMMVEVEAVVGEEVYRFRDGRCWRRHCDYALVYVGPSGEETSLGTVRRDTVSNDSETWIATSQLSLFLWLRSDGRSTVSPAVLETAAAERRFERPRPRPAVPPPDSAAV
ncbi:MAG: hypothetical protein AAF481_13375 [Acidobacteriota bacterium]